MSPMAAPGEELPRSTRIIVAIEMDDSTPLYLYGWARGDLTVDHEYDEKLDFSRQSYRRTTTSVRTSIDWEPGWPVMQRDHPGHDFPRGEIEQAG